ncbi:MAG TPA: translocation/assembly module TamB domain-containing protein, partial [Halomonas sp.]|nr:translocation/assembly module TamB domain-containing protein [Halomonas sp.]
QTLVIEPLTLASREANARLEGNITLSGDYPLDLALSGELYLPERFPALNGERVDLRLGGNLAALDVQLALAGPAQARLDAELDALAPTLPFRARLTSPELRWPLPGTAAGDVEAAEAALDAAPWQVQDLVLGAEGSLLDYSLRLTLAAQGPSLPLTNIDLTGSGDLQHFSWAPLSVAIKAGRLASRGRIDWSEALDVSATLDLEDFDPSAFVDDLDGRLSGRAELSFQQSADGWRVRVPGVSLDGSLMSYPLSLEATLAGDSRMRWQIDTLDFYQGENHLSAAGRVSPEKLDVAASVDMPALDTLYPELRGSLRGNVDIAGTLEAPQLDIDLAGSELGMGDSQLATLSLKGKVAGLEDPSLDIALLVRDVVGGGQRLDEVSLNLDGRLSDHRLEVDVDGQGDGPLSQLALALDGGLDSQRERYAGRLERLDAQTPYGTFGLSDDAVFAANLAEGSAQIEPFCIERDEGGGACLTEPLLASGDEGRASLSIRALPMDLVDAALPAGWSISGTTQGKVSAQWSAGAARWQARANLDSRAEITGEDAYGQPWTVPGTELALQLEADQQQVNATAALTLGESGTLRLALGIADPLGAGELDGTLTLDAIRLAPYRPLASGVETLKGRLAGEVRIRGDRNAPVMSGNISLDALEAAGQDLPLEVRDGQLDIALNGDRADIQGYLASEEGRLNISGDARWPSADEWRVDLALEARDDPLQAELAGFGRLRLAPDLSVRATPERLRVRGEVRIPWSRLEIGKVPPTAVSPSADEVIITREEDREARLHEALAARGESTAKAMEKVGMTTDIRISLLLGPDMQLSAYGLETELDGRLDVRQESGPLQLFGEVELEDGRFRAFGQDLIIREGILYFSGPPGEPLLDFEAIRNPDNTEDDVIAGLKVTGTASNPSLEIFSEPPLDEASALSYVLSGRAPGESGDASGALTSALIGVTLGQAGSSVGALGEAFGIQDLTLDTAGSGEESQVVVSGELSDRLSIGYGVGVFSPIAELSLRYKIWRNLYAEAVSGAAQAVDLIYTYSLPGKPPEIR